MPGSGWSTSTSSSSRCSTCVEAVALGAESVTGRWARSTASRAQAGRGALRAVQPQRRPRREDRGPPRRRPPAGRDPQGALPQERHPRPRRALRRAHPGRDGGAVRHHPRAGGERHDGHLHHPQAQRGARGRGPDHRAAAGPRGRDGRPEGRRPASSSPTSWSAATSSCACPRRRRHPGEIVLSLRDLHVRDDRGHIAVKGVSSTSGRARSSPSPGVQGNGQTELVEAIVGPPHGRLGRHQPRRAGHQAGIAAPGPIAGVAHIPEDRGRDGLIAT